MEEQEVIISLQEYKTLLLAYAELMTLKRIEQAYYQQEEEPKKKQKIGFNRHE